MTGVADADDDSWMLAFDGELAEGTQWQYQGCVSGDSHQPNDRWNTTSVNASMTQEQTGNEHDIQNKWRALTLA
jgi:hypothetical protein